MTSRCEGGLTQTRDCARVDPPPCDTSLRASLYGFSVREGATDDPVSRSLRIQRFETSHVSQLSHTQNALSMRKLGRRSDLQAPLLPSLSAGTGRHRPPLEALVAVAAPRAPRRCMQ